jgi:hypothetical protein
MTSMSHRFLYRRLRGGGPCDPARQRGPGERGRDRRCRPLQRRDRAVYREEEEDGGREPGYFLYVKENSPSLQRACFDAIQASGEGRAPDHAEPDRSHGRVIRRSIWVADAGHIDFPQVKRIARIRRDRCDAVGALVGEEIIHAVTSLDAKKASPEALAGIARGQWGTESVHWVTAWDEDANTAYTGNGPQAMAALQNLAVSLLYLAGVKEVTRTLQTIARERNRLLNYLSL